MEIGGMAWWLSGRKVPRVPRGLLGPTQHPTCGLFTSSRAHGDRTSLGHVGLCELTYLQRLGADNLCGFFNSLKHSVRLQGDIPCQSPGLEAPGQDLQIPDFSVSGRGAREQRPQGTTRMCNATRCAAPKGVMSVWDYCTYCSCWVALK